jgi:subtilisin family serine protease
MPVAVPDSGIEVTYPALRDAVDVEACRTSTLNYSRRSHDVTDLDGHGTHGAGLFAFQPLPGEIMSVVAPGCQLVGRLEGDVEWDRAWHSGGTPPALGRD